MGKRRGRRGRHITKHKANKHDIGVRWKQCPDCDSKAKVNGTLGRHIKSHRGEERAVDAERGREEGSKGAEGQGEQETHGGRATLNINVTITFVTT